MVLRGRKQFDRQGTVYFITTTVLNHEKVFAISSEYYDILIDNLRFYINQYNVTLLAYVLMPNHIHLAAFVPEMKSVSDFMRDFKKFTSVKIKQKLNEQNKNSVIKKLADTGGKGNLKLWKDRFHTIAIENENILTTKINYIHFNPVKAGLVKEMVDWKYSSARSYYTDEKPLLYVSTNWTF